MINLTGPSGPVNRAHTPPPSKPAPCPVVAENVPAVLKAADRWVGWQWLWNGKKFDKPPLDVRTGKNASSTNPATWVPFLEALDAHRRGKFDGIGITFGFDEKTGRHYSGLDLDDCFTDGALTAAAIMHVAFVDSYSEISPSGTGVKVFTLGAIPWCGDRKKDDRVGVEFYDSGRYFTVTGNRLPEYPADVLERGKELAQLNARIFFKRDGWQPKDDRTVALEALSHLDPSRAEGYWDWLAVGMALKTVSDDLLPHWDRWSQVSTKYVPGECQRKWDSFKRSEIGLGSLIHWAKENGWPGPGQRPSSSPPPGSNGDKVDLSQVLKAIEKAGSGSALLGNKKLLDDLARLFVQDQEGYLQAIARIGELKLRPRAVAAAVKLRLAANEKKGTGGASKLPDVVAAYMKKRLALAYMTSHGTAMSETKGREISRAEFVTHTPDDLIEQAGKTMTPGTPRSEVRSAVESELRILWSTVTDGLKSEAEAALDGTSKAGKRFREGIIRLWMSACTFEVAKDHGNESVTASKSTLATRVRNAAKNHLKNNSRTKGWQTVQQAYSCWWRVDMVEGKATLRIAMRDQLIHQVQGGYRHCPGVSDQRELCDMADRYGCQEGDRGVKDRLSGGTRILVLNQAITSEIMDVPEEEKSEPEEK